MAPPRGTCGTVLSTNPATTVGTKVCPRTRRAVSLACFDKNPKTGQPMTYCVECHKKTKAQKKRYFDTDHGKEKMKERNSRPATKESKKVYRNSPIGKAKAKARAQTEEFKQSCREYAKSDQGKTTRSIYYQNHKLSQSMMNAVARVLRGGTSPLAIANSSFRSETHLREHFRNQIAGTAMTLANYGDECWGVDHRIPRSAYDHDDPADVRRCWSPENMRPLGTKENKEKSSTIVPTEVAAVPASHWPKAWNGQVPA